MQSDPIMRVHEFYSRRAHFPLAELQPGRMVVTESEGRRTEKWQSVLAMYLMEDRCLISTSRSLVQEVAALKDRTQSIDEFGQPEVQDELLALCRDRLGDGAVCYTYSGPKLYCDGSSYAACHDGDVREITRANAGEAITHLLDFGIPTDADYLLADGTAFAYYLDELPVAFACTSPSGESSRVGDMMVGVKDGFRRRGFGKAVVSASTGAVLRQGRTAVYGTLDENIASIGTALAVGYRIYCRVFEVRIAGLSPEERTIDGQEKQGANWHECPE